MTQTNSSSDIGMHLSALLDLIHPPVMSEEDFQTAVGFWQAGETLVMFEHICEQLYANNTPITQGIYKLIEIIGVSLGYTEPSHWRDLIPQVRD